MIPFQIPYIILSLLVSFSFYLIILQSFIRKRIHSIQSLQEDVFTLAIGDWNHEIKEMMGGMGINSIESLRGNRLMLRGIGLNEKELQILGIKHAGE
jgi:hypothetical protein